MSLVQFNDRVEAIAGALDIPIERARTLIGSVIVAQMLPDEAVVKGGIGVKFRLGEVGTRATADMDVATRNRSTFLDELNHRLEIGWGTVPASRGALKRNPDAPPRLAFSGRARAAKQARPDGVLAEYLMEPYDVTLHFVGKPWKKVHVEVGHDEIGGLEDAYHPTEIANQIAAIGRVLDFGELAPVPLISLEQQIAQKIHAATEQGSTRAHDLVDLQLLWHAGTLGGQGLDLPKLADRCRRTFAYRQAHTWPPISAMSNALETRYQVAKNEANQADLLVATLPEACAWLNARIEEIDTH
ncbi:hypothetical protein AWC19_22030 [Mycobacterium palustre]|uniref:Nucleotidyl transferase AbiEii/AbiGii toxin family protein n=1 Tax=Mycobacterium palustre TaxID=153971 RepID=A0A1X1Z083_9MYCO|nr:hypothetical protein AWC19_22030 [Mycobacterium palustre]